MTGNGNGKKKSRRRLVLAGIVGVVLLGVVGLVSASRGHEGIDSSKLAAIEKGDIARSVVATGKIEPLSKVQVKSKASGIVKEIRVEYGDPVRKGQVLVDLDKEELSARVREARAVLMSTRPRCSGPRCRRWGPTCPS
jgi:HlyD family secretion protein